MIVQSYQIHNVLKVYRKQLSQGKADNFRQLDAKETRSEVVKLSAEGKNKSVMDKVEANVLKKITNMNQQADYGKGLDGPMNHRKKGSRNLNRENTFIFNTIVGSNQKETRSISINDSKGLMSQLNRLAQASTESGAE